jgi:hypothetical protein
VNWRFTEPASFGSWLAVVGVAVSVVTLEYTLRLVRALWEQELRRRPPGGPLPRPTP